MVRTAIRTAWSWMVALAAVTAAPALADPQPGQIMVDPDHPMWLKRCGGQNVFICGPGDPEDFLYRGRRRPDGTRDGDQLELIRKLIRNGGNCIYLQIVRSHGGDGTGGHNPFVDSDPAKGLSDPILTQWEEWFGLMDDHGILIYLFFYDDGAKIWDTQDRVGREEKAFIEGIVRRFQHHRNLIWLVGEESEEAYSQARVRAIAASIRQADAFGHEVGNHHLSGTNFKAHVPDGPLTHYAMQCNVPLEKVHAAALEARQKALGRYQVIWAENTRCASSDPTAVRLFIWASAMAGVMPMCLRMDIADTPPQALRTCRILQEFFESTDFQTMSPHDALAAGGTRYVLADPGRSYILYAEQDRGGLGALDLPTGRYDLRWLDCVTGETLERKGCSMDPDHRAVQRPDAIGGHCAVWLRRSDGADAAAARTTIACTGPTPILPERIPLHGRSTTAGRAPIPRP